MATLNPTKQLTASFSLFELLKTGKVTQKENPEVYQQQFNPSNEIVENLSYLAQKALQPVRDKIGLPLLVSSGYRCAQVNKLAGGAVNSQHLLGQAADCELTPDFLTSPRTGLIRGEVQSKVKEITGNSLRENVNNNFYLFAYVCLHLDGLDIDQVIHEHGEGFGRPAWVHLSVSKEKNKREILVIGSTARRVVIDLKTALSLGTDKVRLS